jgi:2,4-dienoyl-CoA reductase-like NADH-dependent reductase (Old Yellow Enzyme family)
VPSDPLLEPFQLKHLTLRNRVISTAHEPAYAQDSKAGQRYQLYHEEKAKGGLALTMIGGSTTIAPDAPATFGQLYAGDDGIIPGLQQLADRVHAHGTAVMCQISHMGRRTRWDVKHWLPAISPSLTREPAHRSYPKVMEQFDIDRVVKAYGAAARRCQEGGLDGIEIMCYSAHLIDQFWSPRLNYRHDSYGGSLDNRMAFSVAVLEEVRRQVGDDFVVGIRMNTDEDAEGGLTQADCLAIAEKLLGRGGIDFLSLIKGSNTRDTEFERIFPSVGTPQAPHLESLKAFRAEFGIPIMHATRITDLVVARRAVAEGHVDLVGMVRAHMADPHMVRKIEAGQEERIRPCVGASYCINRIYLGKDGLCIHNPATGREATIPHLTPRAGTTRTVVVVGGGIAGLEAARVAAERGHRVVQFEAASAVGGQVGLLAGATPRHGEMAKMIDWQVGEGRRLGVDLRVATPADSAVVLAERPDVVVVATGGRPNTRPSPELFDTGADLATSTWEVLTGPTFRGRRVLLFDDDGGESALVTAERLVRDGAIVEIATPDRLVGHDVTGAVYAPYLRVLYEGGVAMTPNHRLRSIRRVGRDLVAVLRNEYTGHDLERTVDVVAVEHGTIPVDGLYAELVAGSSNLGELDLDAFVEGRPQAIVTNPVGRYQLFRIGDAVAHRNIHAATYDARRLALHL